MMTDRAAGSGAGGAMFARHMTDDGAGNGTLAATRMGRSSNERKDDRGQGKFQTRFHGDFSVC
jgi:hypothetical protein